MSAAGLQMRTKLKIVGGLTGLAAVGWVGIRVTPPRFVSPSWNSRDVGSVEVPADLPAPVARYARAVFGASIPKVDSALIIGRADLSLGGIAWKGRFRFFHQAGSAYQHDIQLTWFGLPLLTVDEKYEAGRAVMKLPGRRIEDDEKTNLSANLGLWAESIWLPSIWFTDDRTRWVAVDDTTARLIVPGTAAEEHFTMTFDADTDLIKEMRTLRYAESADPARHRWTNTATEWGEKNGVGIPFVVTTAWDDDKPWAVWSVDDVIYNVDVSGRLAGSGRVPD
ncbi:MAG TPA: DUF6544 family protein [Jiangellaceae bacterium]